MSERRSPLLHRTLPALAVPTSVAVVAAGLVTTPAGASSPAEPASVSASASPAITPEVREVPVPEVKQKRTMRMQTTPDGDQADQHDHGTEEGQVVAATGMRPTKTYSMVGVVWAAGEGAEDFEAEVRVRRDGEWTDWQHLHTHDDGPTGDDTVGTAPMWVGDANGVQARVLSPSGAEPRDVKVSLIDPGGTDGDGATAASATTQLAAEGTATAVPAHHVDEPKPRIISRRGWGADESLRERCSNGRYTRTTDVVFVHHTAGTNNYAKSQSRSIVRGIYAYHTRSRGWCDIGYNFLVDKYGQIFEGRFGGVWKPVYGAHTGGYNNNSIGVSLMGNFETARPTRAMKNATTRIVSWKLAANYRHPKGNWRINGKRFRNISGHRDAKSTACPGRHVYNWLPTLRNRVDNRIAPFNTAIFKKWKRLGKRSGVAKEPFRGERHNSGGVRAEFNGADILWKRGPGAHEVHGAIRARYRGLGSQRHHLGFPTSDEKRAARNGRQNTFQRGRIYWKKGIGAREVYGAIFARYRSLGAAGGRLGLPVTGERNAPGGRISKFQGGEIRWNRNTKKITVRYY